MLDLDPFTTVTCHPYRTATIELTMFEMNRNDAAVQAFERQLVDAARTGAPDNFACYVLTKGDESIVVMFCDIKVRVGRGLLLGVR